MLTPSFGIGADVAQPSCPPVGRTRPVANSQAYATLKRCVRGQIFFNPLDQLGNIDRLRKKWMPLDAKASLCFSFGDECGEKDYRRSLQIRIGLNLCRYFASVCIWHHYVEQD